MRAVTVIVDENDHFLSFAQDKWVTTDLYFFEGTLANAIRVARRLKPPVRPAGKRIFVVTDYGYENEARHEIFENGDIGPTTFPNAR